MKAIEIKITIPDYEYEEWTEFYDHGIEAAMKSIKQQITDRLKQDYITYFEIEARQKD